MEIANQKGQLGGNSRTEGAVVMLIRPLDSETSVRVGVIELTERDFPFRFGRKSSHGHEGARHWDCQELRLTDSRPFQVSRDHCVLEIREGRIVVNDRGSTLGSIVDGQVLGRRSGTFVAVLDEGVHELIIGNHHSTHRFELDVGPLA